MCLYVLASISVSVCNTSVQFFKENRYECHVLYLAYSCDRRL
jgi:hypothetical protein